MFCHPNQKDVPTLVVETVTGAALTVGVKDRNRKLKAKMKMKKGINLRGNFNIGVSKEKYGLEN